MRAEADALRLKTAGRALNRDAFLNAIDGLAYDDDPAEGVVVGSGFRHPGLGLALDAPAGFAITNAPQSVTGIGPGNLRFDLRTADAATADLNAVAAARWRQLGVSAQPMRATRINGVEALEGGIRAGSQAGPIDASLTVYRWSPSMALTLVSMAPQGQAAAVAGVAASVRRLTAQDGAGIRGRRVQVVRVAAGDTVERLAARMAYGDDRLARFLTLNQLEANAVLKPGDRVKLVTMR